MPFRCWECGEIAAEYVPSKIKCYNRNCNAQIPCADLEELIEIINGFQHLEIWEKDTVLNGYGGINNLRPFPWDMDDVSKAVYDACHEYFRKVKNLVGYIGCDIGREEYQKLSLLERKVKDVLQAIFQELEKVKSV